VPNDDDDDDDDDDPSKGKPRVSTKPVSGLQVWQSNGEG
jgi:hypothetical protein